MNPVDKDEGNDRSALERETPVAQPTARLTVTDASAIIIGIVIGAGIFKTAPMVASQSGHPVTFLLLWVIGGLVSFIGALVYAELTTAYPDAGGEYHLLHRAFGPDLSFLFAWARMTVIQTGSIAGLAFIFGDYASQVWSLGTYSSVAYAVPAIVILTALNAVSVEQGALAQKILTGAKILGLLIVVVGGLIAGPASPEPVKPPESFSIGLALVFVLFTYGGWNEAAYISAEVRNVERNLVRALFVSIGTITGIYVLVNAAYLYGLGFYAVAQSKVVAADLMEKALGSWAGKLVSVLVAVSALGALNATIITGARTNYALGRQFPLFSFLGQWNTTTQTPLNALIVQALIALVLTALGAYTRDEFTTMVEFTAPVFWFFFLLTGLTVFVLRTHHPDRPRPFRAPLYPLTPLLFCLFCLYMLYSSLAYSATLEHKGLGARAGVAFLLCGLPFLLAIRRQSR
ncbi:MAG: amino acid permease [Armatimonadetes bacterium]|nr:amino acid permease [Armatimonadota bacterium]MDW8121553.1 amino acid permease [Armatimonadota bacterium]